MLGLLVAYSACSSSAFWRTLMRHVRILLAGFHGELDVVDGDRAGEVLGARAVGIVRVVEIDGDVGGREFAERADVDIAPRAIGFLAGEIVGEERRHAGDLIGLIAFGVERQRH